MADSILHAKALPWGGSLGIRISRAEARRLGIKAGQELDLRVLDAKAALDTSHFRTFSDPEATTENLDRLWGEGLSRAMGLPLQHTQTPARRNKRRPR